MTKYIHIAIDKLVEGSLFVGSFSVSLGLGYVDLTGFSEFLKFTTLIFQWIAGLGAAIIVLRRFIIWMLKGKIKK